MSRFSPGIRQLLLSVVIGAAVVCASSVSAPWLSVAQAQYVVAAEFREALSPFGRWVNHSQWGEVWLPDPVPSDWRPYTRGRWVYTAEWGWYWQEADEEAAWGWVTNHYGRWVHDLELGWLWVPGEEWGPAWVDWRYSDDYVGWAPLPPDGVVVSYQSDPLYWSFVRPRHLLAPRVFAYLAPVHERVTIIKRTVILDRDRDRPRNPDKDHHADRERDRDRDRDRPRQRDDDSGNRHANRGIDPGLIARATGKPIRAAKVEPAVVRGTKVQGGREVDITADKPVRATVRETHTIVRPADRVVGPRETSGGDSGQRVQAPPGGNPGVTHAPVRTVASPPTVQRSYDAPRFNRPPPPVMRRASPPTAPVVMQRVSPPSPFAMERPNNDASRQPNRRQANEERRLFR